MATLLTSIWDEVSLVPLFSSCSDLVLSDGGEFTFTPEAMMAATSFCQTSTVSQESLPGPAMVWDVWVCLRGLGMGVCLMEGR